MEKENVTKIINYIKNNKGKCIGALLGFIAAIMILTIGFFKTLFIYILVFIGSYLGKKKDEGLTFKDLIINFVNRINREYM